MAFRPQPNRITWPLTPSQVESIDTMFEMLFRRAASEGAAGVDGAVGPQGPTGAAGAAGATGPAGSAADVEAAGYWSPLTDGDLTAPELIFALGDTIAVWTPTP
jgi:hypothetical protein